MNQNIPSLPYLLMRNLMRIIINIATNMMRPVKSMKAPGKFSMLES